MVLRGLDAAQLSGGDLQQFHGFAVAIGRQTPCRSESAFLSDVSGANVAASVCVTALNTCCVAELTFQQRWFNNWKKPSTQNKMSGQLCFHRLHKKEFSAQEHSFWCEHLSSVIAGRMACY